MIGKPSRPRRPNRVWRWTYRICAPIFTLTILTLVACSFDESLLDTSALRHEPRQIPDAENAYLVLADLDQRLGKTDELQSSELHDAISGVAWDDKLVAALLLDRDLAIHAVQSLRGFRQSQFTIPADLESALELAPIAPLTVLFPILRARQLQAVGDTRSATTLLLDCLHAADLMEQSRGDALHYIYAIQVQTAAIHAACALVSDPRTEPADLLRLRDAFAASRPATENFTQMVAAEYEKAERMVRALPVQALWTTRWQRRPEHFVQYRVPFLFKPNQTLNYIIPDLSRLGTGVDLPLAERKARIPAGHAAHGFLCEQYDDWINRLGKRLAHNGLTPTLSVLLDLRLTQQTRVSLVETLIALRLHHDVHHRRLPATLADLVPAYLPAVPRDYFDGQPVKYSRELRAIWSAGPEGDFHLADAVQDIHERELIIPLCFDGSYTPWPRHDPAVRRFFAERNEDAPGDTSPEHDASAAH